MKKITLAQLLQYYDMDEDAVELIQIVIGNHDWEDAHELYADSELLKPFYEYTVTALRCEESYDEGRPVLRVAIEKGEINHENEQSSVRYSQGNCPCVVARSHHSVGCSGQDLGLAAGCGNRRDALCA